MPSLAISSRMNTFRTVRKKILASRANDKWSTYQTSNSNFLCQEMLLRPFTCTHPVMPGLTSCRRNCSLEYKGRYLGNKGRGPIRAMSPFRTLNSWGNSSMDKERTIRPTFVRRASSGNRLPSASRSSVIVLNLMALKMRASLPVLFWVKNTPAPLLAKCRKMMRSKRMGQMRRRVQRIMCKSIGRLRKLFIHKLQS